ncbi:NAD-dependent epimerase/dehydratase family protein [Streptomyces huiliensis]|uniref:NAD-dependent epimerase/dehydratase family protein n=1 Tax=Streptomyces huiliensis TaxID=2876027 RepID=UPI001CBE5034|nr:NAD(P)-dependent oxidoreductase [Streptomyces huiliensis]MBZ4324050.1 NAD(P)-dependent oxidoreductase [Streptomyces huiliensis]
MTTIAVTGAAGFCGSHIAATAAARGMDVLCVGRRPGPVGRHVRWDATAAPPDLTGADLVVHCAAAVGDPVPGSRAESAMHSVNVTGTARLLEAAAGRPVVYVSSASVYAPGSRRPLDEGHLVGGQRNAYGRTKAAGEALALAAGAVVVRPRAVYGPGDPHLVPRLLSRVRAGRLPLPGPDVLLSLTAVENLADACLSALGWPPGAYNVADPVPYRRDAAIRAVLRAHRVRARIVHLPLPLARAAAAAAETLAGSRRDADPWLTRYAVDQLARGVVLDVTKARRQGWTARRTLADYDPSATGRDTAPAGTLPGTRDRVS